ncbi:MAG: ABC transporter ATP-binding protein [Candidatus Limnocylindria bacterium]
MRILEARDVRVGYGERTVLRGVDLTLRAGERLALIGPNGSGKTTLLRTLAGTLRSEGEIRVAGAPLRSLDARERARRIAVVPQTFATGFAYTAGEIVRLGRTPYLGAFGRSSPADRAAVRRALAETGCAALADRLFGELSGGERQRVVLAMALAQEPVVLLLDEPTVHLDPAYQRVVLEIIRDLARERAIGALVVLHDLNLASLCDRVIALADGRIVREGTPAEVLEETTLGSLYGPTLTVGRLDGRPFVLPRA